MPISRRSAIYAIGLVALASFSIGLAGGMIWDGSSAQSVYKQEAERKASYYANRSNVAAEGRCSGLPASQQRQCANQERDAARQGIHDEYDLEAQRVTAVWTNQMGVAAIIGMCVGIFGIGLIFVTFQETRTAAGAARNTYDAFIALERAALVAEVTNGAIDAKGVHLRLRVKNIGRSTAQVRHVKFEGLPDAQPPSSFNGFYRIDQVMKAEDGDTYDAIFLPGSPPPRSFVGGYVEYRTAFGSMHRSYFCAYFRKRRDTPNTLYINQFESENVRNDNDWPADT